MNDRGPKRTERADVTALLARWREGDRAALESVAVLLYEELRAIAKGRLRGERAAESLRPTGLVHEAWIRLAGREGGFEDRSHFLGLAALAMRSVIVDRPRPRCASSAAFRWRTPRGRSRSPRRRSRRIGPSRAPTCAAS
ncbi:MAG: hypothetical protein Fur0037_26570 [Planctomycetota bacterium]